MASARSCVSCWTRASISRRSDAETAAGSTRAPRSRRRDCDEHTPGNTNLEQHQRAAIRVTREAGRQAKRCTLRAAEAGGPVYTTDRGVLTVARETGRVGGARRLRKDAGMESEP